MGSDLLDSARSIEPRIVSTRRTIHSHPEMGYKEEQTSTLVQARLRDLGIPFKAGLAKTGVVAQIKGELGDGPCVLLRADMDALPIDEQSGVPFSSEVPGVMHACGHDAHTAMLLGAAELILDRKSTFAGTVACGPGPQLAGADAFTITVEGRGGHGARPHETVDPVVVGAQIVMAMQTLVSREVDPTVPAVVTLATFHAGNVSNVIPDRAVIKGTIRAFDDTLFKHLEQRVREVATGVASALRASIKIEFEMSYPPSVCDPEMAVQLAASSRSLVGAESVLESRPEMGAEDFSFVLQKVPGAMLWLGVKKPEWTEPKPVHTATFDIDESALPIGSSAL